MRRKGRGASAPSWMSRFQEAIARQYLYMEVAPWVLPVFGSILMSFALSEVGLKPQLFVDWRLWFGLVVLLLGTLPLGIRARYEHVVAEVQRAENEREQMCYQMVAQHIPRLQQPYDSSPDQAFKIRDAVATDIVETLARIFDALAEVRVCAYVHTEENGAKVLRPIAYSGRNDKPRAHREGEDRCESMVALLEKGEVSEGVERYNGYWCYLAVGINNGYTRRGYGLLTIDTPDDFYFTSRDRGALILVARSLALFFARCVNEPSRVESRREEGAAE